MLKISFMGVHTAFFFFFLIYVLNFSWIKQSLLYTKVEDIYGYSRNFG